MQIYPYTIFMRVLNLDLYQLKLTSPAVTLSRNDHNQMIHNSF